MTIKRAALAGLAWAAASCPAIPAHAQTVGVVEAPCAGLPDAPSDVTKYLAQMVIAKANHIVPAAPSADALKHYNVWQATLRENDFPGLCKYRSDNIALRAPTKYRVVFFGDSITELWRLNEPDLFTNDVIDRGISGQTTEQMVIRFRADVIDLKPAAVHIMAGTNDIAGNTGPTSLQWIQANIQTMVELAQLHGIKVILAAIPPAAHFAWRPELTPATSIVAYNRWLRDYATQQHLVFVDYHTPLNDGHGGFKAQLTADGVHPNTAGYALMSKQARAAMEGTNTSKAR